MSPIDATVSGVEPVPAKGSNRLVVLGAYLRIISDTNIGEYPSMNGYHLLKGSFFPDLKVVEIGSKLGS